MDNNVNKAFAALPERLFIVLNNEIVYEGGMGPFFYNLDDVEQWLANFADKYVSSNNNNNDDDNNNNTCNNNNK